MILAGGIVLLLSKKYNNYPNENSPVSYHEIISYPVVDKTNYLSDSIAEYYYKHYGFRISDFSGLLYEDFIPKANIETDYLVDSKTFYSKDIPTSYLYISPTVEISISKFDQKSELKNYFLENLYTEFTSLLDDKSASEKKSFLVGKDDYLIIEETASSFILINTDISPVPGQALVFTSDNYLIEIRCNGGCVHDEKIHNEFFKMVVNVKTSLLDMSKYISNVKSFLKI